MNKKREGKERGNREEIKQRTGKEGMNGRERIKLTYGVI